MSVFLRGCRRGQCCFLIRDLAKYVFEVLKISQRGFFRGPLVSTFNAVEHGFDLVGFRVSDGGLLSFLLLRSVVGCGPLGRLVEIRCFRIFCFINRHSDEGAEPA